MSMNGTAARARADKPSAGALMPAVSRIRAEYAEMPGLCLTLPQAQRLCGLDHEVARAALTALVELGYLKSTPLGYAKA
jgi:hypothetical protein